MYKKQLGRRNLTDEQKTYLLGKLYEARKNTKGGDRRSEGFSSCQNGNLKKSEGKTAGIIAKEQGVGHQIGKDRPAIAGRPPPKGYELFFYSLTPESGRGVARFEIPPCCGFCGKIFEYNDFHAVRSRVFGLTALFQKHMGAETFAPGAAFFKDIAALMGCC